VSWAILVLTDSGFQNVILVTVKIDQTEKDFSAFLLLSTQTKSMWCLYKHHNQIENPFITIYHLFYKVCSLIYKEPVEKGQTRLLVAECELI